MLRDKPLPSGANYGHQVGVGGGVAMAGVVFADGGKPASLRNQPKASQEEALSGIAPAVPAQQVPYHFAPRRIPWNVDAGVAVILSLRWESGINGFRHPDRPKIILHPGVTPDAAIEEEAAGGRTLILHPDSWRLSLRKAADLVVSLELMPIDRPSENILAVLEVLST